MVHFAHNVLVGRIYPSGPSVLYGCQPGDLPDQVRLRLRALTQRTRLVLHTSIKAVTPHLRRVSHPHSIVRSVLRG